MTQDEALAILESGKSAFLTGAAGSGKTYLLRKFIRRARRKGLSVAVTATTGLAATHLGGTTIHSWSGIGIRERLDDKFFKQISKQRADLIRRADILIIDEISMFHDYRLDLVELVTRVVREDAEPFGGLQVVVCGDFFQLPPVNRMGSREGSFVTESDIWRSDFFEILYLSGQYRQKNDSDYNRLLEGIRKGNITEDQVNNLYSRKNVEFDETISKTRLLTINADVDSINEVRLGELKNEVHEFEMQTTGGKRFIEQLKKSCLAQEVLRLKIGSIVMCIKNSIEKGYSNGSIGEVVAFDPNTGYPIVLLNNGREVTIEPDSWELMDGEEKRATIKQIPLRLAWAITVHKSQGMTLDYAQIDLSRAFVEGMGYVALSRVRSLDSLSLDGINNMALRTSDFARNIDEKLLRKSKETLEANRVVISSWSEELPSNKKVKSQASTGSWADRLSGMRKKYPNAYKPWSKIDDEKLLRLYAADDSVAHISSLMGRHEGAIRSRIQKLVEESTGLE